jgi:type I restriction enzyme S subunit
VNSRLSVRLDAIATVVRGVTYAKGDVIQTPSGTDIPILRAGNIDGRLITDSDLVWLPRRAVSDDQMLQPDDIVMCMSSGSALVVGKSALLDHDWRGSFGAFCAAVRTDPLKAEAGFLAHVLAGASFRAWASAAQGNNIKNLKKSALQGYQIPLPPLVEQRRIVALLDRAAEIRRRAEAARAKAREIIPALFLDSFGDPVTMSDRFDSAPLGDLVADRQLGLVRAARELSEEGDALYLRMNSITGDGRVELHGLKRTTVTGSELRSNELRPGDLLFNTRNSRELVGKMGVFDGPAGIVFNNNILRLRFRPGVLSDFVNWYFQTPSGQSGIEIIKKGTTTVFAVYYRDLSQVVVPLPPLALQSAFARHAEDIEALARNLDAAAKTAEAMAAALSAEVFQ